MGLLDFLYQNQQNGIIDPKQAEKLSAGNGDITGLLQQFGATDQEKNSAMRRGLLTAGLNILSADPSHGALAAIASGGAQGVNAYDDQLQQARAQKMQGYQMQRQNTQDARVEEQYARDKSKWGREDAQNSAVDAYKQNFGQFQNPDGTFDERKAIAAYGSIDPAMALKMQNDYEMKQMQMQSMRENKALNNRSQFGGQELLKDEAGNLFYGTSVRDPSSGGISSGLSAVDGSGVKPQGRLMVANNPYGLTSTERVVQVGSEAGAKDNATAVTAAKTGVRDFSTTMDKIDRAAELLPNATNSGLGSIRDKGMAVFGATTDAAKNAAELETIGGWLTSNVPRMQGPQSDKDVEQYRIMAGNVADKSKPYEQRMQQLAALKSFMASKNTQNQDVISTNNAVPSMQKPAQAQPKTGGVLHVDGKGRKAMVYPDGSYEVVQ